MKQLSSAPRRAPRSAFTLVELLIVIAIIALLAGLLFPVFAKVRENGRTAACNSNLHQLGLAFTQYISDYGGRLPRAANLQNWADGGHWVTGGEGGTPKNYDGTTDPTGFGLANPSTFATIDGHEAYPADPKSALYSYVKSTSIFMCPSATDNNKRKLSYSMNCALAGAGITRVRTPADLVLLVDEGKTINDGYFWATKDSASTDALFDGHNGGGNLLFVDGHVKFYTSGQFPLDSSPTGLKNKWRGDVAPRFHDHALGVNGSNSFVAPSATAKDTCNASLDPTKLRNWTTEP